MHKREPIRRTADAWEYILGDSDAEIRRLARQAELWDPVSRTLFDAVGVAHSWRVLEIGPGVGSLNVELRRRVGGPVDAVEPSPVFAKCLMERIRSEGWEPGRIWQTDLERADLPSDTYDLVFLRWVVCFLPDPTVALQHIGRSLRPNGFLIIQDYAHRESFALFPRPAAWLQFLEADRRFFASQGGNVSVGGTLPSLLSERGFSLLRAEPTQMTGSPGSLVWAWLRDYFLSVREPLTRTPPLTEDVVERLAEDWQLLESDPWARVFAPLVVGLIAKNSRSRRVFDSSTGRSRLADRIP